jgi:hypothetical protein
MEKTMQKCQSATALLTLPHLDDGMWTQISRTLSDCGITLNSLDGLVQRVAKDYDPEGSIPMRTMAKPGKYIKFMFYSKDISKNLDKVEKSNRALQTVISIINV